MKTNPFLFLRLFFFDYSMRNCNDGHYSVHLPMIMVCVDCVWLLLSIAQKILVYGYVRASLSELMCTLIPCSHRHHHLFWFDVNKKRKQILIGSSWLRPANRQPIIHYRVSRSCVECPSPPTPVQTDWTTSINTPRCPPYKSDGRADCRPRVHPSRLSVTHDEVPLVSLLFLIYIQMIALKRSSCWFFF